MANSEFPQRPAGTSGQRAARPATRQSSRPAATSARTPSGRTTKATPKRKPARATTTHKRTTAKPTPLTDLTLDRAVSIQIGAVLAAKDRVANMVDDLISTYQTGTPTVRLRNEIDKFERRGARARARFERRFDRTRNKAQREVRKRGDETLRTITDNFESQTRGISREFDEQRGRVAGAIDDIIQTGIDTGRRVTDFRPGSSASNRR